MMFKMCDLSFLESRRKRWVLSANVQIVYAREAKLTFQDANPEPQYERWGAGREDQGEWRRHSVLERLAGWLLLVHF